jgi:hypothetical protein
MVTATNFRAVNGLAFAGSFSARGNSKPVTTFAESTISASKVFANACRRVTDKAHERSNP